jgi:hypothetical protein
MGLVTRSLNELVGNDSYTTHFNTTKFAHSDLMSFESLQKPAIFVNVLATFYDVITHYT